MEKYNLLILLLDNNSNLLDTTQQGFSVLKNQYALENATLVLIYIGEKANRIIAGQQINEIDEFPKFDGSEGTADVSLGIQRWAYEAQMNMYSGSSNKTRTAIFVDISNEICEAFKINPSNILGTLEDTDYYYVKNQDGITAFEQAAVTSIEKLEVLAKTGDDKAQYSLGLAYVKGDGVPQDTGKAQSLFYNASRRGNTDALFALIDYYDDPDRHISEEAAERGHLKAQWLLGKRYYSYCARGEGSKIDLNKAEKWLKIAADRGHQEAMDLLKDVNELRSKNNW